MRSDTEKERRIPIGELSLSAVAWWWYLRNWGILIVNSGFWVFFDRKFGVFDSRFGVFDGKFGVFE
jgi:hypothetical protein